MLVDKEFVLSAYECYRMDDAYGDENPEHGTIFIISNNKQDVDEDIPAYSITDRSWYTKRLESFYNYFDSSSMICQLHPIENQEADDIIEQHGGYLDRFQI